MHRRRLHDPLDTAPSPFMEWAAYFTFGEALWEWRRAKRYMLAAKHSASYFERIEESAESSRRRWSLDDKLKTVEETRLSDMRVTNVAQKYGIAPSLLFRWRKLMAEGARKPCVAMIKYW